MRAMLLALVSSILLSSCSGFAGEDSLVGVWTAREETLIFNADGSFDVLFPAKPSLRTRVAIQYGRDAAPRYEALTDSEPHQLYMVVATPDRAQRIPMGIYKIEDGRLLFRIAVGGGTGVSLAFPSDFSEGVGTYERQQ